MSYSSNAQPDNQFGNSKEDGNVYQLRMDLEMKAQKLGYEEEAFDHIMEPGESDTESNVMVEEEETETETETEEKPEIASAIDQELKEVVERQLDDVLGEDENPFENQVKDEFEGDACGVRFDPGGTEFMEPHQFAQNLGHYFSMLSNRFASQIKRGELKEWKDTSRYHYLTDEEILESLTGESGIQRAFRSDALTRFVVITIDKESYYREAGLLKLRDCLMRAGVNHPKLYSASDSDQWQLFVFLEKPVRADRVSEAMKKWLRRNNIIPGTAGIGVFPGSGSLTIPLQPGFEFLNEAGVVIAKRDEITLEAALALFLADMTRAAVCGLNLIESINEQVKEES